MAIKLFITPAEIKKTTIIGGNVDVDKFTFSIANVMITVIEPLLGSELFDKINDEFIADTLAGDYLFLFDEFVKPITKFEASGEYIEISGYTLDNAGLFRHAPDNAETVDIDETYKLSQKYRAMAQMYVQRFDKWICKNSTSIPEYKIAQDEVNAQKNMSLTAGWYFGNTRRREDCDDTLDNNCCR